MIWHWMCHMCADTKDAPVNLTCYWGFRHMSCVHIQKCPCSHGHLHITFIKATGAKQRCCLVCYLSKQMNLDYKTFHTCLVIDITVCGLITKAQFWIGSDRKPTPIFTRTQISGDILCEVQKLKSSLSMSWKHIRGTYVQLHSVLEWDEGEWPTWCSGHFAPQECRYPLNKRPGGPQNLYGWF